ncbi:MAG: hypothetical protein PVH87_03585 [Desulfobacteraceae bacterium]|jgi:hypothetical protein
MMEANQITKQMIDFNQTTFNNAFDAMVLLQDQFEKVTNTALDQIPGLPAEGRKAIEKWAEAFKEGRKNFKAQIDNGFEQAEKLFII